MKANRGQIAMIHVLKGKLNLPDEHYRDMLASFGVSSCASELFTHTMAKEFIQLLTRLCKNKGVEAAAPSSRDFLSPAQSGLIIGMWSQVSKQPDDTSKLKALDAFLVNRFKISKLQWVPSSMVPRIIHTLKAMGAVHAK
jgi:hypothetical protein